MNDLAKAMGFTGISKGQVHLLRAQIGERVHAFPSRLVQGSWPYLRIDAAYLQVRQARKIVSTAVTIAVAVSSNGRR